MSQFLTIALVQFLALLSPGPDFFFVSQAAVSSTRKQAIYGAIGATMGVAVWSALALIGLQLLLMRLAWLERLIAIAGGFYLGWMGIQMVRSAWRRPKVAIGTKLLMRRSNLATLRAGLLTWRIRKS